MHSSIRSLPELSNTERKKRTHALASMAKPFNTRIRGDENGAGEESEPLIQGPEDRYKGLEKGERRGGTASASSWKLKCPAYNPTWARWNSTIATMAVLMTLFAVFVLWMSTVECAFVRPITPKLNVPASIQQSWAQYSPYFAAAKYPAVPANCAIDQVRLPFRFATTND